MSKRGTDRSEIWILLALGLLTAAVAAFLAGGGWMKPAAEDIASVRTSRSTNVDGVRVYYELLDRLGYELSRLERPWDEAALAGADIFVVLDPLRRVQAAERRALHAWLQRGGWLITTQAARYLLPDAGAGSPAPAGDAGADADDKVPPAPAGPLSRHVAALDDAFAPGEAFAEWVGTLGERAEVLCRRGGRVWVAGLRRGEGAALVLADSGFLANGAIGEADHAVLAANLIRYAQNGAGGDRVVFNEYHFGFGAQATGWTVMNQLLLTTSAGWSVLAGGAAGILFLLYRGRRFGSRRDPERRARRSRLEFVEAAAAAMQKAGAHRWAFRLNFEDWLRGLRRDLGLSGAASPEDVAAALARRTGIDAATYTEVLRRCERAAHAERAPSPASLQLLYRRLADIEWEINA